MPTTVINIPKEITTLEQFNAWCKSLSTDTQDLEIWMKRRTSYYPYDFTEHAGKIDYLISDGVSRGLSDIKSFNRIFKFQIRTY